MGSPFDTNGCASVRDADYTGKWKVIHWKTVNTTAFLVTSPVENA